jgi:hypothetical protein
VAVVSGVTVALAVWATGAAAATTAATPIPTSAAPATAAPTSAAPATAAPATGATAMPASCRSYPRPGTTATAPVPALVLAEYGALRRPRRPEDRIAVRRLGRLPESGILAAGIRRLATVPGGGRAYLVPSLHLLAAPMRPVRCVPAAQRARQACCWRRCATSTPSRDCVW